LSELRSYIQIILGYRNCNVSANCTVVITAPNFDFDDHFIFSPNPAKTFVNLSRFDNSIIATTADILNLSGRQIKKVTLPFGNDIEYTTEIFVGDLTLGTYILRVPTNKGVLTTQFFKL